MFDIHNYLRSQPTTYKADEAFKRWLKENADADTKRHIIYNVEKRIKTIAGTDDIFPHIEEKTWKRLESLINIRQVTLNELMEPTESEVKMMSGLNDRLHYLTQQMYSRTFEMWKVLNDAGLNSDDHCVETAFDFDWNDENAVKRLDNDDWYGSDFTTMLGILNRFDHTNNSTMKHIHVLLQDFAMSEEKARKNLIDTLDDGDTWTDGALLKPAFKDITVCYMLHAICCHFHYSLADVLRMDNFKISVHAEYEHNFTNNKK